MSETETPRRETAADRRAMPTFLEIAVAAAEREGVCVNPMVMQRTDTVTGKTEYIPVPCGNTRESVCPACAAHNRNLRIAQCREGWHLEHEPPAESDTPTQLQTELFTRRSDLIDAYKAAKDAGDTTETDELRDDIAAVDVELRATGFRGRLMPPDLPCGKRTARRSTRRRQDVPDLPRRKVDKTRTVGPVFGGRFQPSMFITLTLPSNGKVHREDSAPLDPGSYDYRTAARNTVHFSKLVDRWIQNLRRVVGYDVQYFATVEPQRRGAPHIHIATRSAIPHQVIRMVTAATYHQVWWPNHDDPIYPAGAPQPRWDVRERTFVDPATGQQLSDWDTALEQLDAEAEPAHVVRFGAQVDSKGILGGTEEAGRHIGYLTKYLVKSVGEVLDATTDRQRAHYDRLHAELELTPCSPRCPVWLRFGIVPRGAGANTIPGRCKGKAHRRDTLGLPGRRVLVSRRWSGKTLADHKADRREFVRQLLADAGIQKPEPEPGRYNWRTCKPGDRNVPPREHLLMAAVAQRTRWRAEYNTAKLAAEPPGDAETSATQLAA